MIKICGRSIAFPLRLIFESALHDGIFPDQWKKGNIVPIHKKGNKNLIKNYRPISLLPMFSKIFERVIFNSYILSIFLLINFLQNVNLDSFLAIHAFHSCSVLRMKLYTAFDCSPTVDVRGVFLDISKAFDKVWHEGLLFKLKSYGIEGQLFNLLQNYLFKFVNNVSSFKWTVFFF